MVAEPLSTRYFMVELEGGPLDGKQTEVVNHLGLQYINAAGEVWRYAPTKRVAAVSRLELWTCLEGIDGS